MQNMMQQITGNAEVTTSRDGILITKHGEGNDLIDKALANNGTLPEGVQPVIQRTPTRAPATQPQPTTSPDMTPVTRPTQTPTPKP